MATATDAFRARRKKAVLLAGLQLCSAHMSNIQGLHVLRGFLGKYVVILLLLGNNFDLVGSLFSHCAREQIHELSS